MVESERGFFVVEVAVAADGPMQTTILLDTGGSEQKILAPFGREVARQAASRPPAPSLGLETQGAGGGRQVEARAFRAPRGNEDDGAG